MSDKKFNVAIIGYGLSAKVFHIPFINLVPQFALHTIVQRSPSADSSAPADHPSLVHHTSPEPMFADPAVDVVCILTPPGTHFDLASAALRAGKHVLVEKPFVPSAEQADKLIALAKEQKRHICVYQNRRWDADFLTLRHLIADGTIGRVVELDTHFDRYRAEKPSTWKGTLGMDQGGGVLYDLGSHLIDQAYVLFGTPRAVYGRLVNQRDGRLDPETPDSLHAVLSYPDGNIVTVRAGVMSVENPQPRFWVRGTKGSWRKAGLDPQEGQLKAGALPSDTGFGVEDPTDPGTLVVVAEDGSFEVKSKPTAQPETYVKLFEGFARAIAEDKEELVPVPASEARDVLRILEAVRESAKTGKEVILE
ncbi:oxidoreductase [Plectosphaerella plurivora]|uniref:Oxidoreductase n=1 Tax=Plectosphaerella plurivora TaxID=936078 RepID=A0A9P8V0V7_9PEZI|nr:oxidoreductase [Plectosphaerella plurivora]